MTVDAERAYQLLEEQLSNRDRERFLDADWYTWLRTTEAILRRALGDEHHLLRAFTNVEWPLSWEGGEEPFYDPARQVEGILRAAIFELQQLTPPSELTSNAATDPDLWQYVAHLIQQEQWSQVASQTAIFVEDRMRQWAGLGPESHGADLASRVLHPENGKFPLGVTRAEQDGWHQLGRGFVAAVRNVDGHRIQQRDDLKRYALGVVGSGSLLLTQLRYQHQNRFVTP